MTTSSGRAATLGRADLPDDGVAEDRPLAVHSCSRLGRTANPPRFSIRDWFRFGRRR